MGAGETCCEQSTGDHSYDCCSYSNAVCCNDNKRCCPSGHICPVYSNHCISIEDGSVVPRKVTKQSFVKLPQVNRIVSHARCSRGGGNVW